MMVYLQAQCKSYLDAMHSHSLTQLTGSNLYELLVCICNLLPFSRCSIFSQFSHGQHVGVRAGLLEQEQWSIAFVALDFQRSVDALQDRAAAVNCASADSIANGTLLTTPHQISTSAPQSTQPAYQNGSNGAHLSMLAIHFPYPASISRTIGQLASTSASCLLSL